MADTQTTYKVGKGNPPKSTRFKKGQSGNPNGAPKKPKVDVTNAFAKEFNKKVTANDGTTMTKMEAMAASTINDGINKNSAARNTALKIAMKIQGQSTAELFWERMIKAGVISELNATAFAYRQAKLDLNMQLLTEKKLAELRAKVAVDNMATLAHTFALVRMSEEARNIMSTVMNESIIWKTVEGVCARLGASPEQIESERKLLQEERVYPRPTETMCVTACELRIWAQCEQDTWFWMLQKLYSDVPDFEWAEADISTQSRKIMTEAVTDPFVNPKSVYRLIESMNKDYRNFKRAKFAKHVPLSNLTADNINALLDWYYSTDRVAPPEQTA